MKPTFRSPIAEVPTVTKNLIIINAILLLATWVLSQKGIDLTHYLALYYPQSENFHFYQFITHMFMHGGIGHLFFNMFALWMFGRVLESVWGPRRFLIFYLVTGLGAAALHTFVNFLEINPIVNAVSAFTNTSSADLFYTFITKYQLGIKEMCKYIGINFSDILNFANSWLDNPNSSTYESEAIALMNRFVAFKMNIPTVGASGAVYGVLLGFGMLFPNTQLMLLFPPIPIKAKYMVIAYGALELILGLSMPGSNIAHFAHLGGMLFGFFLIKYWNKTTSTFY
jgi:membrane associated rhomboid family serine protease